MNYFLEYCLMKEDNLVYYQNFQLNLIHFFSEYLKCLSKLNYYSVGNYYLIGNDSLYYYIHR